jgi:trk system potassium uptake protein TrkH
MLTTSESRRQPVWHRRLTLVLRYQIPVLLALAIALWLPLFLAAWDARGWPSVTILRGFLIPSLLSFILAGILSRLPMPKNAALSSVEALLITTTAWLTTGFVGALPLIWGNGTVPIDAIFESISGFTTAGTTMLTGIDQLPRAILLWRTLTQWLGGLGILLIVLLVGRAQGRSAYALLSAEGVKVDSGRLSLNFRQAAVRFMQIYLILTLLQTIITFLLGMSFFDAISHAMTTVATGGFSPHDESIAYYRARPEQFPFFLMIEWVVVLFMIAGSVNFYILFRLGKRQFSALWDGLEMRLLWLMLGGGTLLISLNRWLVDGGSWLERVNQALFQLASMISTTGYETSATGAFPPLSKAFFFLVMIVGGCAGSTAGGIKLIRLGIIGKFLTYESRRLRTPPHTVLVPRIDGHSVNDTVFRQSVFILLLWLIYLAVGGLLVMAMAPDLAIADAFSTVFTAIGVFGPSFISVAEVIALPVGAKIIFIIGMLAGRLEILPLIIFFNPAAWRRSGA